MNLKYKIQYKSVHELLYNFIHEFLDEPVYELNKPAPKPKHVRQTQNLLLY